jgi:hypothetical protein
MIHGAAIGEQVSFPQGPQEHATGVKNMEVALPERWICVVIRRETIRQAVGKMVHIQHVCLALFHFAPTATMNYLCRVAVTKQLLEVLLD